VLNETTPETPAAPVKPTREAIEDFLNGLKLDDLFEAVRSIEGTKKAKAAALRDLADELDPQDGAPTDEQFADWYATYPRKVGKGAARKAFKTAVRKVGLQRLQEATKAYALHCSERESDPADTDFGWKYVPHPASWLNGERFDDEDPAAGAVSAVGKTQQQLATMEAWLSGTGNEAGGGDSDEGPAEGGTLSLGEGALPF